VMYASQRIWLNWIAERFMQKPTRPNYSERIYGMSDTVMPLDAYQGNLNYFLEYATAPYEVA
jgi:hypothetical protein